MNMDKKTSRQRRARKTRAKIRSLAVPRLTIHRTPRHMYAQVIDSTGGKVLASASTLAPGVKGEIKYGGNRDAALPQALKRSHLIAQALSTMDV